MKQYNTRQIIEAVRIKYDEHQPSDDEMIHIPDDSDMNVIITSNIEAAYRFCVMSADSSMLEGKPLGNPESFSIDDNLVGHLILPADFLRGVTVRLSSWHSSSKEIIGENSPEYRMQSDPYACGTPQQPVTALVHTANGKELEFYKAKDTTDTLRSFVYLPLPSEDEIQSEEGIQIPDQLAEPFIYYVAALTATTFREDIANDFFKVAKSLLGVE